jgi:predicted Zn-dependent protease
MLRWVVLISAAAWYVAGAAEYQSVSARSPVEDRIAGAEKRVQSNPKSWQSYNELAAALCRKARDSGDVRVYEQAQTAVDNGLRLAPDNFETEKLEVTVLLGKGQAAEALKLATKLNNRSHDDLGVWGLLVDANVALGNNSEAERDAQWILNLRPGSSLGFVKAAGLRVLFGDPEGAVEFYAEANRRTSANDADEHAWLLTEIARQELAMGKKAEAERAIGEALKWFPDSHRAMEVLVRVREAQSADGNAR